MASWEGKKTVFDISLEKITRWSSKEEPHFCKNIGEEL